MATYYVAKTGSDSNAGTASAPKLTINAGLSLVGSSGAGHIVEVGSGVYAETIHTWPSGSSSGNPFILRSATQYGAILRPTGASQILFFNTNYVTVDGLVVDGVNTDANNVWFQSVTGVTFQNGEIKNVRTGDGTGPGTFQAIYSHNATGMVIRNNLIHDIGTSYSNHASHGIYMACRSSLIEGNKIYKVSGWGMQIYSESVSGIDNNTIRNNRIFDYGKGGSAGGVYMGGMNNSAYNNLVYEPTFNSQAYGFIVANSGNKVWFNTIFNNAVGIDTSNASSAEVRNNLLCQNGYSPSSGDSHSNNITVDVSAFVSVA